MNKSSVDITGALNKIHARLLRINKSMMILKLEGYKCRTEIHKRTLAGRDAELMNFKAYSTPYILVRQGKVNRKGVAPKSRHIYPPDLTFTGDMMRAMKAFPYEKGFEIKFTSEFARLKAENHNFGNTVPQRHFFAFDREQKKRILLKIATIIGARVGN